MTVTLLNDMKGSKPKTEVVSMGGPASDPANDLSISFNDIDEVMLTNDRDIGTIVKEDDDFNAFSSSLLCDTKDQNDESSDNNSLVHQMNSKLTIEEKKKTSGTQGDQTKEEVNQSEKVIPENSTFNETKDQPKQRYVTPQDFDLLKVIGMGAFGKVLQVKNKHSNKILAMKVISKRLLKRKTSYVQNIHAEREILTKVKHPFIVTMHCSFQSKEKLFIIMDFLAGGELFLRLGREGIFVEKTAGFYIAEITLALEHLHSKGVLHRDLKPENILLSTDGHLCITDFGLAKDFQWDDGEVYEDGRAMTVCGTTEYMAPEMVARKGYGKAADWWSLGCIAFEMLSGNPPFESKKGAKDLFRKIMNERVKMPDGSSSAAHILLKGLLNRNATARFGAAKGTMLKIGGVAQIKQLAFFSTIDWGLLELKKVDPPEQLHVDNDEDVRHFYDEFTTMGLPRSVIEMSHEDFEPRRCQSGPFRGFSFIQEDFELPLRSEKHEDQYWNNVEADGESLSDCASSLGGFDEETATTQRNQRGGNMTIDLESTPELPAKKKRPPRKKKKKIQQDPQQEQISNSSPLNAKNKDTVSELNKEIAIQKDTKEDHQTTQAKPDDSNMPLAKKTEEESTTSKFEKTKSKEPTNNKPAWNTIGKNITGTTKTSTIVQKSKKQIASQWETVEQKSTPLVNNKLPNAKTVVTSSQTATIPNKFSSVPSTSVNMRSTLNKSAPTWVHPAAASKNTEALTGSASNDWRSHTLVRNISGSARSISGSTRSVSSASPSIKDAWPSLGGSTGKGKNTSSAPQSIVSKSTWAAKCSSQQSQKSVWGK